MVSGAAPAHRGRGAEGETTISPDELAERLADVMSRVESAGERFVVERDGRALAVIAAPEPKAEMSWDEFLASYSSTWPRADNQFADDLQAVHASQPPMPEPPKLPD